MVVGSSIVAGSRSPLAVADSRRDGIQRALSDLRHPPGPGSGPGPGPVLSGGR